MISLAQDLMKEADQLIQAFDWKPRLNAQSV